MMDQKMPYCYYNNLLRLRKSMIEFTIDGKNRFASYFCILYAFWLLLFMIPLTIDYKPYPIISEIAYFFQNSIFLYEINYA